MPRRSTKPLELHDGLSDDDLARLYIDMVKGGPSDNPDPAMPELWVPDLTPRQMDVFLDESDNTLVVGNRYTGKGWSCAYNLVKHAYDHFGALVLVVVRTKRQGSTGGFFSKLASDILPDFEKNIGLSFRGPYMTQDKDSVLAITNRYGGTSVIQLMSILHEADVEKKILGIECSKVYIDEAITFESEETFSLLRGTLKRRRHIPPRCQTLLASTNPGDPSHWLAKKWNIVDPENRGSNYRVLQVMKEDNPDRERADAYYAMLEDELKNQPTRYARYVKGEWVALPSGESLFGRQFVRDFHVRGDVKAGELLRHRPGTLVRVGVDIGDTNHGLVLYERIRTAEKELVIVLDEIVHVKKQVSIEMLAVELLQKLQRLGDDAGCDIGFQMVSDNSAFNRFRATTGSHDHAELEKHLKAHQKKYPRVRAIPQIKECPKPQGSVVTRTRLLQDLLANRQIFFSANCTNIIETVEKITAAKDKPMQPDTRDKLKHALDALTYGLLFDEVGGSVTAANALTPQIISIRT